MDSATGRLWVDGEMYQLTICEARCATELLAGEIVVADPNHEPANLSMLIMKLRRKTPLQITALGQSRGYMMENIVADHETTRPKVEQAASRIKGAIGNEGLPDLGLTPVRSYNEATGVGKVTGENADVNVEVIIKPKEITE